MNIRELKNNPTAALREAREDMVVVMNRDVPQALLVDLHYLDIPDIAGVRMALAVVLFKQGNVSLGYAARIADKSLPTMITTLGQMGIPIVTVTTEDAKHDFAVTDTWFQDNPPSSLPTQAR